MVSFGPVMRGELVEIVQRQTAIDGQVFGCPQFERLTVGQEKSARKDANRSNGK